jgi:hypothetical protein
MHVQGPPHFSPYSSSHILRPHAMVIPRYNGLVPKGNNVFLLCPTIFTHTHTRIPTENSTLLIHKCFLHILQIFFLKCTIHITLRLIMVAIRGRLRRVMSFSLLPLLSRPPPLPLCQGPIPSRSLLASLRRWKSVWAQQIRINFDELNAVTSPIACAHSPDSRCHAVKDGMRISLGFFFFFGGGGSFVKVLFISVCAGLAVALVFYSSLSFCERLVVAWGTVYVLLNCVVSWRGELFVCVCSTFLLLLLKV